jgi:hypothetical protein
VRRRNADAAPVESALASQLLPQGRALELFDLRPQDVHFQETQIALHFREDGFFFLGDVMLNSFLELANERSKMLIVTCLLDPSSELSRLNVLPFGFVREVATHCYTLSECGIHDLLLRLRMHVEPFADLQRNALAPAAVEVLKQGFDLSVILPQQITNL